MKKVKGHFWLPSVRPTRTTRHFVPRCKVTTGHWTPKGDCKVTGKKERNQLPFYKGNTFKIE